MKISHEATKHTKKKYSFASVVPIIGCLRVKLGGSLCLCLSRHPVRNSFSDGGSFSDRGSLSDGGCRSLAVLFYLCISVKSVVETLQPCPLCFLRCLLFKFPNPEFT